MAECREAFDAGRDGASALTIVRTARQFGLRARAYSLQPAALENLPYPAIIHWNFNHFVVLERCSPAGAEIVDPAHGRRRLTAAEFEAGFTGVALLLEPDEHFQRRRAAAQPAWRHYGRALLQVSGTRVLLAQLLLASLVLQLLGLALPLLTKLLVDQVLPYGLTELMPLLGLGALLLVLAQLVTSYLRAAVLVYLQGRLDSHMMLGFFEHVLALPFRFFQQRSTGDLITRIGSNMLVRETLTEETLSAVLDGMLVLGYLVIVLLQAPHFGLLVLVLAALQIALLLGTTRRVAALTERHLVAQANAQGYLVEALTAVATLKASGTEDRAHERWSRLFMTQLNISLQRSHLSAVIDTMLDTLRTLAPLALMWFGALQVMAGTMSLGTMLALLALAAACLTPLASLVGSAQQLQLVGAYLERLSDVFEAAPEQTAGGSRAVPQAGRIELRQVGFRYNTHGPWVLRDVSLAVEPGQKVALVGRSGSGKSTLALLLLGLYTPGEGTVEYGGVPLQQLDYRALRRQFGVVLQEPTLFSGSLRENIAFNRPGLSLPEVTAAAELASVHADIERMPMGYETQIAEGGRGLSGGQIQRIALARALAGKPSVLLLDEATSHLDGTTERQIEAGLQQLNCTRFVVAHRLSTVRDADLILVLDNGSIVERGTHDELLALDGHYAGLVRSQAAEQASVPATA